MGRLTYCVRKPILKSEPLRVGTKCSSSSEKKTIRSSLQAYASQGKEISTGVSTGASNLPARIAGLVLNESWVPEYASSW